MTRILLRRAYICCESLVEAAINDETSALKIEDTLGPAVFQMALPDGSLTWARGGSQETECRFTAGNNAGEVAPSLEQGGIHIDTGGDLPKAIQQTQDAIAKSAKMTLFEGTFEHNGVLMKTDLFFSRPRSRRLVEVKSSAPVKDYHHPDVAVQYWVLTGAGYEPNKVELAHIKNSFVYPGDLDYRGLFTHVELTKECRALQGEVGGWVKKFKAVVAGDSPVIGRGDQCGTPASVLFMPMHCEQEKSRVSRNSTAEGGSVTEGLPAEGFEDLRDVPEHCLTRPTH